MIALLWTFEPLFASVPGSVVGPELFPLVLSLSVTRLLILPLIISLARHFFIFPLKIVCHVGKRLAIL